MTAVVQATRSTPVSAAPARRRDIDGLRAFAIALVVVYHVWFGRVSGGVDVFLMISALFLTASFVRASDDSVGKPIVAYWLRRFASLLPAAAVTLIGVLVTAYILYPASSWPAIWSQTWASLFYVQNWELAASAVDYYNRDGVSPLQHFWSLSMQGQVFFAWPVLILLTSILGRWLRRGTRPVLIALFSVIFAVSFAYSVLYTADSPATAYFDTFARLWEFALGSLLALVATSVRVPSVVAALLGWAGISALILCGLVLDVQGGFPGYLALWPTLAAAAVIVAGRTRARWSPTAFLESRPMLSLGRVAYALYLVHWPVLVTWLVISEQSKLTFAEGAVVIAASLVLAYGLTYLVEKAVSPRAMQGRGHQAAAIGLSFTLVAIPVGAWQITELQRAAASAGTNPGAEILVSYVAERTYDPSAPLVPAGSELGLEWAALPDECGSDGPRNPLLRDSCRQRNSANPDAPTVVVVGDSHAGQWMAPLLPAMESRDWNALSLIKGGCSFAPDEAPVPGSIDCERWRTAAVRYLEQLRPDVVFMMGTKTSPQGRPEWVIDGVESYVDRLVDAGSEVVLVRDNPRFTRDMFACVERNGADSTRCEYSVGDVLARNNPMRHLDSDFVTVVDLSDMLCPNGMCKAAIGGVVVYLDDNHLTRAYGLTLAPAMEDEIAELEILR